MRFWRPTKRAARGQLLAVARTLAEEGLVIGSVGNASYRAGEEVVITPTRLPYSRMGTADLVPVGLGGDRAGGRREPSRELPLHLAVYRRRPDVGAVIHTHSAYATAWSFLGEPLLPETEENEYYGIGPVRSSPPEPAGSDRLATTAAAVLGDSSALLLGRHGVLAAAADLEAALLTARVVEHQAKIAWLLRGGASPGRESP